MKGLPPSPKGELVKIENPIRGIERNHFDLDYRVKGKFQNPIRGIERFSQRLSRQR